MKAWMDNQRGTAAIEFAIVLPLLMVLIFGIIEFGLVFYDKAMVTNASREAARAGIVYRDPPLTVAEMQSVVDS
ncbi:MAG: TadE/TadG family type IV pilus assembly protein, partial [Desulfobacterales bacterium]